MSPAAHAGDIPGIDPVVEETSMRLIVGLDPIGDSTGERAAELGRPVTGLDVDPM